MFKMIQGEMSEVVGDVAGENIVKVACAGDCVLALSEKGEVFGWGNSEYGQLKALTEEQQISIPRNIPLKGSRSNNSSRRRRIYLSLLEFYPRTRAHG